MPLGPSRVATAKIAGLLVVAVVMTPLATGLFRGMADLGASADTSQEPYYAGELVAAYDHYREGFTSFPSAAKSTMSRVQNCGGSLDPAAIDEQNADNLVAFAEFESMLVRRRRAVEDVRANILQSDLAEPMITLYTSCIRDSLFAPICASQVDNTMRNGLARRSQERSRAVKEHQALQDQLMCTFLAGVKARASQPPSGQKQ